MSTRKGQFMLFGRRLLLACSMSILLLATFAGRQTSQAFAASSWSYVRVFHASPDAGIVDVFMDGSQILSNFQYGSLTGYTPVSTGSHKIQIGVIGSGANAALVSQTLNLRANMSYTVVALGTKATGYSLEVFTDNNAVYGNLAKARVYHLSPGTGVVNVESRGHMLISDLPYAQASDYVSISPGSYTFNVVATQNNTTSPISVQLKPWTVTSIFVLNSLMNGSATTQLQFVQAQITGMPGMPQTGSDPRPLSATPPSQPLFSWPWALLLLAIFGTSIPVVIIRRAVGKSFKSAR